MKRICLCLYSAVHYRRSIFKLMDKEYDCEFNFVLSPTMVKQFDTNVLHGKVNKTWIKKIGKVTWHPGITGKSRGKFDYYICSGSPYDFSTWILLLKIWLFHPRKKLYFWTHGWYGKETAATSLLKTIFFKLADGIILYGNHAKKMMIERGFDENNLFVIHNSLDYDRQLEIRTKLILSDIYTQHFGNNHHVIIFIGRLTPVKQLDILVKAVNILKEKGEYYNLVFIGDGPMKQQLSNLVDDLSMSELTWFFGECYDEQKNAELIYNADLCVAPGNIGLTAMHVMSFGCPAISHNDFKWQMPEFEAIRSGETGDFFERGNVNDLANAIHKWFIRHNDDRDKVRTECFREIDERWTPKYQMKILKRIIV